VTKKDIARAIAGRSGIRQVQALAIVQCVFDSMVETLASQGRIELRNFGVFEVRMRKPRKARNPHTGESVSVPARLVVIFRPGQVMAERVGALKGEAPSPPSVV
jgi:nucleoid DNA-binding protein